MDLSTLSQIEKHINNLPIDEQLQLIERMAQRVRENIQENSILYNQLTAMSADPEIQSELQKSNKEFLATELDGLETL